MMYVLLVCEKHLKWTSFIGAVAYGCSLWFSRYDLWCDFMADAMLWVPLVVLGIQRVYQKPSRGGVLVIGLACTLISNFYFAFTSCIFYLLFVLVVNPIIIEKRKALRSLLRMLIHFVPWVVIAFGIAAVGFIPSVYAFFSSDRIGEPIHEAFFSRHRFSQNFG